MEYLLVRDDEEQEVENKSIIHLLQHLVNGMECPSCSSRDIEFIESSGHRVCVSCGTVLEENAIVSSVEFQECGDRSHVVGQFVSATSSKVRLIEEYLYCLTYCCWFILSCYYYYYYCCCCCC